MLLPSTYWIDNTGNAGCGVQDLSRQAAGMSECRINVLKIDLLLSGNLKEILIKGRGTPQPSEAHWGLVRSQKIHW